MPEKRKRVLIMEDEPVISKVIARALGAEGFEIDTAENGLVAKSKIDTGNKYDLFIFDIRTPVLSGIQLFEYLEKKHPELPGKVIFMTGDCLNTATGLFLERVKRPYLTKPFTPSQIQKMAKQVLESDISAS